MTAIERASLPLALLALAGVAWLALRAQAPSHAPDVSPEVAALAARLDAVERAFAATPHAERTAPGTAGAHDATEPPAGALRGRPDPLALPPTLDEVARRLATLEKRVEGANGAPPAAPPEPATVEEVPSEWTPPLASVEDAVKALDLDAGQRAEFERVTADATRENDALRALPDANGLTWEQYAKERWEAMRPKSGGGGGGGGMVLFGGPDDQEFRERVIPGRAESFGEAARRIHADAMRRLEAVLSPAQREKLAGSGASFLPNSTAGAGFFGTTSIFVGGPTPAVEPR